MIKFVVFDFDGVFTDGKIYFGPNGHLSKAYNGKDSYALKMLRDRDIRIGIITTDKHISIKNAPHIFERLDRSSIGLEKSKLDVLNEWLIESKIDPNEVAYMGDDIPDIGILGFLNKFNGLSGCPLDAIESVKSICKFVSTKKGGDGAVREFVEFILSNHSN